MEMKYLPIYVNDHYAGSTAGAELAKRAAKNNRGNAEFGPELTRLAHEIDEDRDDLKRIMARLGVSEDRIKATLAWAAEKAGRAKPNGELLSYSPLSRLVEIEGLISGVGGKHSLWRVLLDIAPEDSRLDEADLERLAGRAEGQLSRLHDLRGSAAREAFAADIA
jgi:hypothetical protein